MQITYILNIYVGFIVFVIFPFPSTSLTILGGTQTTYDSNYLISASAITTLDGDNFTLIDVGMSSPFTMFTFTKNIATGTTTQVTSSNGNYQKSIRLNSTHLAIVYMDNGGGVVGRICTVSGCSDSPSYTIFSESYKYSWSVELSRVGNHTTSPQRFVVAWSVYDYMNSVYLTFAQVFNGDFVAYSSRISFAASHYVGLTSVFNGANSWYWLVFVPGSYTYVDCYSGTQGASGTITMSSNVDTQFAATSSPWGDTTTFGLLYTSSTNVYFHIFNYQMTAIVSQFAVAYDTSSTKTNPAITALGGGSYAVAWSANDQVYGNVVSSTGNRAFSEDVRFDDIGDISRYPSLAAFGTGASGGTNQYVAAWAHETGGLFKIVNLPSVTPSPSITPTKTPTPSVSPSVTPSISVSPSRTSSPSRTPSVSPTPSVTPTPSMTSTPSVTPTPSITPTSSITPSSSPTPSVTPTSSVTPSPSPTPSVTTTPSLTPTASVTTTPSSAPTVSPTGSPSITPTSSSTPSHSNAPSITPTASISQVSNKKENTSQTAVIAGCVAGGALVIGAGVIGLLLFKRRRANQKQIENEDAPSKNTELTGYANIPAKIEESTDYSPLQPSNSNGLEEPPSRVTSTAEAKDVWNMDYADIKVIRKLGAGAFGEVWEAKWKGIHVAVKQLLNAEKGVDDFFGELELMKKLKPHPHVVALLGVCLNPLCLVTEFVANGDLHSLLKKGPLTDDMKMNIVQGIAAGMFYLHQQGVIHRDLAARNILLDSLNNPKVSDFGMSRVVLQEESGNKTVAETGPIRWMAPEAMSERIYNTKTDVWSFGVVIYEILTQKLPYHGVDMASVAINVTANKLSLVPAITQESARYPPKLVDLLILCLQFDPQNRPEFSTIVDMLD